MGVIGKSQRLQNRIDFFAHRGGGFFGRSDRHKSIPAAGQTGTVILSSTNTYTGGTTIDNGTLELASSGAGGSAPITFAASVDATVKIDLADTGPNTITGHGCGGADTVSFGNQAKGNFDSVTAVGQNVVVNNEHDGFCT